MSVSYRLPESLKVCGYELERQNVGSNLYYVRKFARTIGIICVSVVTVRYKDTNGTFEKPFQVNIENVDNIDIPTCLLEKAFLAVII